MRLRNNNAVRSLAQVTQMIGDDRVEFVPCNNESQVTSEGNILFSLSCSLIEIPASEAEPVETSDVKWDADAEDDRVIVTPEFAATLQESPSSDDDEESDEEDENAAGKRLSRSTQPPAKLQRDDYCV